MRTKIFLVLLISCVLQSYKTFETDSALTFSAKQTMALYNSVKDMKGRLPRSIDEKGKLITSDDAWWGSGFTAGTLWYLYEYTSSDSIRSAAETLTKRIERQQYTKNNHDIGFMIYCSYGNAYRLTNKPEYKDVIINAAHSLSTRFNPVVGVIRSWDNPEWTYPVIIDNLMNLELLCEASQLSGDSSFLKIAVAHADTTLKYHFRPDGSSYHLVDYNNLRGGIIGKQTHQGYADESAWARGQAWALYGYTMMYRETKKPEYLQQAIKIANFIVDNPHLPADKIPYWDFDAPGIPNVLKDASAGAVICSALLELSDYVDKNLSEKYTKVAEKQLSALSSPEYLATANTNGNFILKHSVGHFPNKTEIDVPLPYTDYYFVEALIRYKQKQIRNIYKEGWIDFNKNGIKDIYEDPAAPLEKRVENLLSQMTIDEKTCQLATLYGSGRVLKDKLPTPSWKNEIWKDGIANIDEQANGLGYFGSELSFPYVRGIQNRQAIQRWFVEETRLGIPVDYTNEGIRGLCSDRAMMFPAQCGQGATWNRDLIREIAQVTAEEANVLGYTNIYSPILDIAQDPRWGRVVECYGEDPYLVGELGKQMITGLQSNGLISTPKHFAVYSIPVGGRDGGTRTDPHVAPREMRTLYLEPFRKAFQEAGALGVMSSYNDYDGDPITGSYHFLTEILRGEYGFKGYVVSDSEAVEFMMTKHHIQSNLEDVAAQVINAGLNVRTNFSLPENFILPLRQAIADGKISKEVLNSRVTDVLKVKFLLGLFDNPYKGDEKQVDKTVHSKEHQAVSLKAALQSMVLLKNENNLLPLSKNLKKIAVIGPNADEAKELICRYGPANAPIQTVYQGIKTYLPLADVQYAKGCDIIDKYFPESELYSIPLDKEEQKLIDEAVSLANKSEAVILVLGGNEQTVREEYSRTNLDLCGRQQQLLEAVYATGKPVVLVMIDGRAATINWAQKFVPAILHGWFPGEFMGIAVAQTLFGDYNPGGKLAVTFPKSVGQIPFAFPFKPGSDSKARVGVDGVIYPFGHGLSYTTFQYSDLVIDKSPTGINGNLKISCKIKNTGKTAGDEVVQLYLRDDYSSVTTYTKVLRGFERIHLAAGEEKAVEFALMPQQLGLWNKENKFVVEPGTFSVMIGSSSEDIRLHGSFEVK